MNLLNRYWVRNGALLNWHHQILTLIYLIRLMCDLPNNEEALHTAQMQLMPSRQALNELMLWMDGVEATINEDEGKTVLSLMDVQLLLQKYRVNI